MHKLIGTDHPGWFGKVPAGKVKTYWSYRVGKYRVIANHKDEEIAILMLNLGYRTESDEKGKPVCCLKGLYMAVYLEARDLS